MLGLRSNSISQNVQAATFGILATAPAILSATQYFPGSGSGASKNRQDDDLTSAVPPYLPFPPSNRAEGLDSFRYGKMDEVAKQKSHLIWNDQSGMVYGKSDYNDFPHGRKFGYDPKLRYWTESGIPESPLDRAKGGPMPPPKGGTSDPSSFSGGQPINVGDTGGAIGTCSSPTNDVLLKMRVIQLEDASDAVKPILKVGSTALTDSEKTLLQSRDDNWEGTTALLVSYILSGLMVMNAEDPTITASGLAGVVGSALVMGLQGSVQKVFTSLFGKASEVLNRTEDTGAFRLYMDILKTSIKAHNPFTQQTLHNLLEFNDLLDGQEDGWDVPEEQSLHGKEIALLNSDQQKHATPENTDICIYDAKDIYRNILGKYREALVYSLQVEGGYSEYEKSVIQSDISQIDGYFGGKTGEKALVLSDTPFSAPGSMKSMSSDTRERFKKLLDVVTPPRLKSGIDEILEKSTGDTLTSRYDGAPKSLVPTGSGGGRYKDPSWQTIDINKDYGHGGGRSEFTPSVPFFASSYYYSDIDQFSSLTPSNPVSVSSVVPAVIPTNSLVTPNRDVLQWEDAYSRMMTTNPYYKPPHIPSQAEIDVPSTITPQTLSHSTSYTQVGLGGTGRIGNSGASSGLPFERSIRASELGRRKKRKRKFYLK